MSLARDRRIRNYTLIPFVIIGILAGAIGGLGFALGGFEDFPGAAGPRNPASLLFFIAPPVVLGAVGWIAYRLAHRLVPARDDESDA